MTYYKQSKETILSILHLYLEGNYSFEQLSNQVGIHKSTLKEWYLKLKVFGEEVFDNAFPQRRYTKEQKLQAVEDFLSGAYSLYELMVKHQISGRTILMKWVKKYTSPSELKDSDKGLSRAMTTERKTTMEERMHIARVCIEGGKNYK